MLTVLELFRHHHAMRRRAVHLSVLFGHSRESGNPGLPALTFPAWMPAFAGMTRGIVLVAGASPRWVSVVNPLVKAG